MATLGMITVVIDNYDRAIEYFTKVLGFYLVEDTELSPEKRWVVVTPDKVEGAQILLAQATSDAQKTAIGNQSGGRVGFFLYTENFERDYLAMVSRGVTFVEQRHQESYGKVVVFQDIYGNKWDFIGRYEVQDTERIRSIVIMGVSGSGKSTIGKLLAERMNSTFIDADSLHSEKNIEIMLTGNALSDEDRAPWLRSVGEILHRSEEENRITVIACSALKRDYRDTLRTFAPNVFFVFLEGPHEAVEERVHTRKHEFMPSSLLASQFEDLEPLEVDERGIRIDISHAPEDIVGQIANALFN